MRVEQIPDTEVLGVTAAPAKAAMLLNQLLAPGGAFTHMEIIYGAERSGRVFYQQPRMNAIPLQEPLDGVTAILELQKIGPDTRYHPVESPGHRKGWSIEKGVVRGAPAVIVWCEWAE